MSSQDAGRSDREWRQSLTPEQYHILREKGTEPPHSGIYNDEKTPGTYRCAACGSALFSSNDKYDSGSGWPSFIKPHESDAVITQLDESLGMERTEVVCATCGGHLGHVFDDGPSAMPDGREGTGQRFCINSLALNLDADGEEIS